MLASITGDPIDGHAPQAFRALRRGTRPLKRWRYIGVFGERLMACAALVQIGPARQSFWALHLPGRQQLRERTRMLPRAGEVQMVPGTHASLLVIRDLGVQLDLVIEEQPGIQARCPHGRHEVWTRKQAGVRAHGTLSLDGSPPESIEARAVVDDTAGYHDRHTEWRWSAGVGTGADGSALAWNLVSGVNDPPSGSERAVWVNGAPHEVGPVELSESLDSIRGEDGSVLRFAADAQRSRRENLLLVSSDYRAPFGSFQGELPGHIALASGLGVMEHHRARW